jgi:hypothetical protein
MSHAVVLTAVPGGVREDRIEAVVTALLQPFDENDRRECFADGSRWDWWVIGGRWAGTLMDVEGKRHDFLRVRDLSLQALEGDWRLKAGKAWDDAHDPTRQLDAGSRSLIYGIQEKDTRESYIDRGGRFYFYAFLAGKTWHEQNRLGWWAQPTRTECQIADPDFKGKCLHTDPETGARIVSWGSDPTWEEKYHDRFIKPLDPADWIVVVDYHV